MNQELMFVVIKRSSVSTVDNDLNNCMRPNTLS